MIGLMITELLPSWLVLASKNAACGSLAIVISIGVSINIQTLPPPSYSPAAAYLIPPESIKLSSAPNISAF